MTRIQSLTILGNPYHITHHNTHFAETNVNANRESRPLIRSTEFNPCDPRLSFMNE